MPRMKELKTMDDKTVLDFTKACLKEVSDRPYLLTDSARWRLIDAAFALADLLVVVEVKELTAEDIESFFDDIITPADTYDRPSLLSDIQEEKEMKGDNDWMPLVLFEGEDAGWTGWTFPTNDESFYLETPDGKRFAFHVYEFQHWYRQKELLTFVGHEHNVEINLKTGEIKKYGTR